jgi:hypothetical protein
VRQEAETLKNLLSNKETMEMGFDMAKELFNDEEIRAVTISWYRRWHAQVSISTSKEQYESALTSNSLFARVTRYLELMGESNAGLRDKDLGELITRLGHSGAGSGPSTPPTYRWTTSR